MADLAAVIGLLRAGFGFAAGNFTELGFTALRLVAFGLVLFGAARPAVTAVLFLVFTPAGFAALDRLDGAGFPAGLTTAVVFDVPAFDADRFDARFAVFAAAVLARLLCEPTFRAAGFTVVVTDFLLTPDLAAAGFEDVRADGFPVAAVFAVRFAAGLVLPLLCFVAIGQ